MTESYDPYPTSTADMSNSAATYNNTDLQSSVLTASLPVQSHSPGAEGSLALSSSSPSTVVVTGRQTEQPASAAAVAGSGAVAGTTLVEQNKAVTTTPVHALTESTYRFCTYHV